MIETLTIVPEKISEATGATFRAYPFNPFRPGQTNSPGLGSAPIMNPEDGDQRIAMLPVLMIKNSPQVLPFQTMQQAIREAECSLLALTYKCAQ